MHGWGEHCANAKKIICSWEITFMEIRGYRTTLIFDLVNGKSSLIFYRNVEKYSDTFNRPIKKQSHKNGR